MPDANPTALAFLETRRSRPAKTLEAPAPDRDTLRRLLTIAARAPDHGKLEPWRFLVLERPALQRLAESIPAKGAALGIDIGKIEKAVDEYGKSPLAVVVVASPKPSDKVPEIEQTLSAGAVCLQLLNGALAAGWGADFSAVDLCGEFADAPEGFDDGVADFVVGGEIGVAEPVVSDHTVFVGVDGGAILEGEEVLEGAGDFGAEAFVDGGGDIHEGCVEGEAEVAVAQEAGREDLEGRAADAEGRRLDGGGFQDVVDHGRQTIIRGDAGDPAPSMN